MRGQVFLFISSTIYSKEKLRKRATVVDFHLVQTSLSLPYGRRTGFSFHFKACVCNADVKPKFSRSNR